MKIKIWLILFIGVLAIAFSAVFVKLAHTSAFSIGFFRMATATLAALPLLVFQREKKPISNRTKGWAILAGFLFSINLAAWNSALLMHANATTATLLMNLAPLWTGLIALFFMGEKLRGQYWLGLAVALVGLGITYGAHFSSGETTGEMGLQIGLFASFVYALYQIFSKKARLGGLSGVALMCWANASCALSFLAMCLWTGAPLSGFSTQTWLAFLGAGLVSSLLGWSCASHAMGHLPISVVSVALLNQATFTAVLDYFIFGERLTVWQLIGGLVVLFGQVLVVFQRKTA